LKCPVNSRLLVPLVEFKELTKLKECLSPQEEDNQSEVLLEVLVVELPLEVELPQPLLPLLLTNPQLQVDMLDLTPSKSVEVAENAQDVTRLFTLTKKSRLAVPLGIRVA
jgi:hypothetical protein